MKPRLRLAALAAALLVSACAAGTGVDGAPGAAPTFWPAGVPTPQPPRGAPEIGPSEQGAELLQIAYEPPHLRFSLASAPEGTYSVIYAVASSRYKADKLQIDSVDPRSSFAAMLEYDRLTAGEYTVRAYLKNVAEPVDTRKLVVP